MKKSKQYFFLFVALSFGVMLFYPGEISVRADFQRIAYQSPRFILYFGNTGGSGNKHFTQEQISTFAVATLNKSFERYSSLLGRSPKKKVALRFFSPSEFRRYTGAPEWTSAMYYKGEITIPIDLNKKIKLSDLGRALKHEYAHAVVAELSGGRCPAWLDEGLAQLLEGKVNPLLGPALRKWISQNKAMPLSWLQNGFTLLDSKIVPAAYAQSLFSVRKIVSKQGYEGIGKYLRELEEGKAESKAFESAFGEKQSQFVSSLTRDIQDWSRTREFNP